MADVARVSEFSRATIYKYFPTHRELVAAVDSLAMNHFAADLSGAIQVGDDVANRLGNAAVVISDWWSTAAHAGVLETEREGAAFVLESGQLVKFMMDVVRPTIKSGIESGELRDDMDLERATEWVGRILQSLASMSQSHTFNVLVPIEAAEFVREFVVRGLSSTSAVARR